MSVKWNPNTDRLLSFTVADDVTVNYARDTNAFRQAMSNRGLKPSSDDVKFSITGWQFTTPRGVDQRGFVLQHYASWLRWKEARAQQV